MSIHYLYLITRDDGERYVGVTSRPDIRFNQHKNGNGSSELYNKNFIVEILDEGDEDYIYSLEDSAIKAYKCSLNKVPGGKAGNGLSGSLNGRAKLKESDVVFIKRLAAEKVSQKEIAECFGVSRQTIGAIATGVSWKHVNGPVTRGRFIVPEELRCQIRQMYSSGKSIQQIASHLNIKYATAYSYARGTYL